MPKTSTTAVAVAALLLAPTLSAAPAYAQTGNPLNSIFSCQSSGNKQAGGAVAGAVIGGLLGNSTGGKRSRGVNTVLGAAAGAAVGSYIGCRMQTSDQQRAEAAAQRALQYGENTSWNNPETGASGRINVISSRPYEARPYDARNQGYNQGYQQPVSLRGVRFASGVQPQNNYFGAAGEYEANNRVNLRGGPSTNAAIVGRLQAGESFDALARVRGANGMDWILVGRDRTAIGYVAESVVTPVDDQPYADSQYDRNQPQYGARASNQMCRTFDQTITTGSGDTETNRYTACQTPNGEWVVQA
jgi:surface antigen